jgi:hypothetical protein
MSDLEETMQHRRSIAHALTNHSVDNVLNPYSSFISLLSSAYGTTDHRLQSNTDAATQDQAIKNPTRINPLVIR